MFKLFVTRQFSLLDVTVMSIFVNCIRSEFYIAAVLVLIVGVALSAYFNESESGQTE